MKLTFLGSGSAFSFWKDNFQSNLILESDDGKKLLIDCGSDVRQSLRDAHLTYKDIDSIFISHLHSDHTGGLEWLGFTTKFDPSAKKAKLYISTLLFNELHETVVQGGLSTIEGEIVNLSTFFNVHSIEIDGSFTWSGIEFQLVQTIHTVFGYNLEPSFGLLFSINHVKIFFTGDTQLAPYQIRKFYEISDIIFQDCEIDPQPSHMHARFEELKELPAAYKNKMWLYHYGNSELPDPIKEGFRGFIRKGQSFDFSNLDKVIQN